MPGYMVKPYVGTLQFTVSKFLLCLAHEEE